MHRGIKRHRTGSWQRVLTTLIISGSLCWLQHTGRRPSMLYRGRLMQVGSRQRRETTSTIPVSEWCLFDVDTFWPVVSKRNEHREGVFGRGRGGVSMGGQWLRQFVFAGHGIKNVLMW